jgi:hypothetical protein
VDVRALVEDPQSFQGWFAEVPALRSEHRPYRLHLRVVSAWDGSVVLERDVYRADVDLSHPGFIPRDNHYAPGARANIGPTACLNAQPQDCRGTHWFRLLATPTARYWDTTPLRKGPYRLTVTAWDQSGNSSARTVDVRLR